MRINQLIMESDTSCPECGGPAFTDLILAEKKDACYHKVKASAKVWPSAYASGRLVQCRKKGAANYGNKSEDVAEGSKEKTPGVALSKAYKKDFDDKKPGHTKPDTALTGAYSKTGKPGGELKKKGVAEGMLDNPGEQESPVAQAIIRRILLQRTDLLAKHGPEKVGQAVDEVADFVGDVDEIGSSDVSGWVRHVEQMLGNMEQNMAESDVEEGLGSKLAGLGLAGAMALGSAGAQARVSGDQDPNINRFTGKPVAAQQSTDVAPAKVNAPAGFSKEYLQRAADPNRTGRYIISVEKAQELLNSMQEGVAEGNMISKIKAPAAPSSPALAAPRAPAVAETLRQIDRMLESVTSKKSAEIVNAYADQQVAKLGLRNTAECKKIMAHVVHESAVRRRAYAQRMAK